jgi:signal transduction histidine kinase
MLVENLLDWFSSQQGTIMFSPLVWELASVIQQAVHSVKIHSDIKKIQITSSVDDDLRVFADKEMLNMVLRNLLSNAVKFTEIGGYIHVGATKAGEQVTVSVKDSGVGVDQDIVETLFHKVQRVSVSGTEGEKGTGLGLYLSGQFIHMNGGNIWFESSHPQGSTFFFTLPAKDSAGGAQAGAGQEFDGL